MLSKTGRLWALLCLVILVRAASAHSFSFIRRDDNTFAATTQAASAAQPQATGSTDGKGTQQLSSSPSASTSAHSATSSPSSTNQTATSALPTVTPGSSLDNSTFFNVTIPDGQLPLSPQLTPGWGVAGVIMLVTGAVYTMVGIKNRWIHTFFSTAYMTALGVAVLIVYVMNVPVSDALQGAYVVAVVMSGCAVGAAAMFFKELTEGLGCALGGFCISMWLLCLVPGGLLQTVPSKAVFIAIFTIVGFASYFSRWTRDWALIILIAFGGSTITVLGIDSFSRAGLKEFWAYVWAINDNLFPLGADTYPVTKGIRVETAAIIIIFLMGIISQIKLWRIVREKRLKRAAEHAEDQRNLEREEENVGRQVEESNARERRQWERIYGDGATESGTGSRVTDFGDSASEKRLHPSYAGLKQQSTAEVMETASMSESDFSRHGPEGLLATEEAEEGKVTVRIAADDVPESTTDLSEELSDEKPARRKSPAMSDTKRFSKATSTSKRISHTQSVTEAPEVIPLPFKVPPESGTRSEEDRSSIATFADEAEMSEPSASRKHQSLEKRFSDGSASLLQSFPPRPDLIGEQKPGISKTGKSSDDLFAMKSHTLRDDGASLAATIDDESISEVGTQSKNEDESPDRAADNGSVRWSREADVIQVSDVVQSRPFSMTAPDGLIEQPVAAKAQSDRATQLAEEKSVSKSRSSVDLNLPLEASDRGKSIASVSSKPASLTKDRLSRSLSKVALSYRTNEWAKHLSNAERPEPDELLVSASGSKKRAKDVAEKAVPVNMEELKQTAEDGGPPPIMRRSASQASDIPNQKSSRRISSRQDLPSVTSVSLATSPTAKEPPTDPRATSLSQVAQASPSLRKSSSVLRHTSSNFKPIVEEQSDKGLEKNIVEEQSPEQQSSISRHSSIMALDTTQPLSPTSTASPRSPVPGVISYSSPQTLIGQRERFLKSKSQANLVSTSPEPALTRGPGSDAGSLNDYTIYAAALNVADADDVPLNQRKEMIRQSSIMSLARSPSQMSMVPSRPLASSESSESLAFNSHQPKRVSTVATFAAREAQLASFRHSVQHDLRSGTPIIVGTGRETPFGPSTLLGSGGREAEIQRNIEMQRHVLMGQKEAEAQRKEMQKRERDFADRAFDERMRNGDMLEAHREALRKMQKSAR
ncbi:hypothetical protein AAL_03566 [Moelleriella libera RCEF 2490]|uniref:TM7S3/TM198-like domain-containing protein n=1 Tax=Moelleriella libera RCEF 2490 TaxID=1081109 RepID=A0A162IRS6_9HYPO|nr:hypothetical protein AAL_03566 [Moelleriella libera RCEF 2490]